MFRGVFDVLGPMHTTPHTPNLKINYYCHTQIIYTQVQVQVYLHEYECTIILA